MATGAPGDPGDNAPGPVGVEFSLPIATATTQPPGTTGGTAQASGPSTAPATSPPAPPTVSALLLLLSLHGSEH